MTSLKSLLALGAIFVVWHSQSWASEQELDCTDPMSYGQSFDALKACRTHRPKYENFKGQRVRMGSEMLVCEVEQEIMLYEVMEQYCENFVASFPERRMDLRSEARMAVSFARSTLVQLEGVEDFLSSIYADDGLTERVFAGDAWEKARSIADAPEARLFEEKKISLQALGASGELVETGKHQYAWSGTLHLQLYRNVGEEFEYRLEKVAERDMNMSLEVAFHPDRASEISPLGAYITSFDANRDDLLSWVVEQIYW